MQLHHSNQLETLAGRLADLMRDAPGDPFAPERIVIHHPSLGRWLSLELARSLGIAANLCFEQPSGFAWSVMREVCPKLPTEQPYAPGRLRWQIHEALPAFAQKERRLGAAVRGYLRDGDARKQFELSERLAQMFDRCLLYRPDWIREWEQGDTPHWQARLWQRLVGRKRPAEHWVAAVDAFRAARVAGRSSPGWPRRVTFFAVPALSPSYCEVLSAIGDGIDIHHFMLNPCREYWGDIYSRREISRRAGDDDPGEHYLTEGNELLAAWGRAGRDTLDTFIEITPEGAREYFEPLPGVGRLAAVQRDILDLRLASEAVRADGDGAAPDGDDDRDSNRSRGRAPADGREIEEGGGEDSLQIHVCHSPEREAEVLHDRLLGLFDRHPDIEPADVLVLTPDISRYGPAIRAVFGAAGRIPCQMARARHTDSRTLHAFFELIDLAHSRFEVEAVLAPLDAPAVRARFGLGEADLPMFRERVREAGIRWGVDAAHRVAEQLPETAAHTWRHGLDRLVLGHAMATTDALFAGLVPCPGGTGTGFESGTAEYETLGRFLSYCEAALGLRRRLAEARAPGVWVSTLYEELDRFCAVPSIASVQDIEGEASGWDAVNRISDELGKVRQLIQEFGNEAGECPSPIPARLVGSILRERAGSASHEPVRLADGVTVAALGAGQIFPAKVICIVGMNDGVFPRAPEVRSFDVMASQPARRGDRDLRYEDRFAFLEALLAARRAFLVSYTGRGLRDDAALPPSVLVDELHDYLKCRFPEAGTAEGGSAFLTHHPLQPFSPRYFATSGESGENTDTGTNGNLYSYSRDMCEAANRMVENPVGNSARARFRRGVLPEPDASWREVDLADLIRFFANPTSYFLKRRLGLRLDVENPVLDGDDWFMPDGLGRHQIRAGIRDRMHAGLDPERVVALLQGSGELPQATLGRVVHEDEALRVEQFERLLEKWCDALAAPPHAIEFELDGFRITGTLSGLLPASAAAHGVDGDDATMPPPIPMVWWRLGSRRPRDEIEIRLRQLAWAAAGHPPLPAAGIFLSGKVEYSAPEDAIGELRPWLAAWARGFAGPLPFFPRASLAYAREMIRKDDAGRALEKARDVWESNPFRGDGERDQDPGYKLVFDGDNSLDDEFEALAKELLGPLCASEARR